VSLGKRLYIFQLPHQPNPLKLPPLEPQTLVPSGEKFKPSSERPKTIQINLSGIAIVMHAAGLCQTPSYTTGCFSCSNSWFSCRTFVDWLSVVLTGMHLWRAEYGSFIYTAQQNFCTRLIVVPLTTFHRLAEVIGDPKGELIFVVHTARCGSTLLTRVKQW